MDTGIEVDIAGGISIKIIPLTGIALKFIKETVIVVNDFLTV